VSNQKYHILLLTEAIETYYLINNYLKKINKITDKYNLEYLSNFSQWSKYANKQQYAIYLVEDRYFSSLEKQSELRNIPIIVLSKTYEDGLKSIQAGAKDYWHLQKLNLSEIERSLRLILDNNDKSLSLKNKKNIAFYEDFFNDCIDGLFSINILADGTLIYGQVNSTYARIIGFPQEKIIGQKIIEIISTSEVRKYQDCLSSQRTISYEHTVRLPGGYQIWLIVLVPVKNKRGTVFQLRGSARDITKEKQANNQQIRHARYRNLLRYIALKIRQSLNINNIIATTVTELQKTLHADRVIILKFLANGMGKVIEESVNPNFSSMLEKVISEQDYAEILSYHYEEGSFSAWSDIKIAKIDPVYQNFFRQYQIRANLIIPIFRRSVIHHQNNLVANPIVRLWGLLSVQQCSQSRKWTKDEIELLQQLVEQLNVALSQAELLESEVKQRQELARSNTELEQFAYIASHDLQAPLQTISNYAQLIEHRYRERLDEKADKYINYIVSAVERMKTQINDLLEYSKVNRQQNTFRETDFRLVVEEAIANLQSEIELNQAEITYSDDLPILIVDRSQFAILFQNLISNSLKYRRAITPKINIDVTNQNHAWQFSVRDNGIGIAEKHQTRIFQIFQRLHSQDEYPGTGIGLAICQKIVQRHGGNIWVESIPDRGTTFYFTIPNQTNLNI
jgi:PAS domain S-box-containing protein